MHKIVDGIYQIEQWLPEVGGLNLYFLDGDMPTLVDTGPVLPGIKKKLRESLLQVGRQLTDLKRIIITHGHVDHYGLAKQIWEISGAEVIMTEAEKQLLSDFQLGVEKPRYTQALRSWGVPEEQIIGILEFFDILTSIGEQPCEIRTVKDGDSLVAGQWNWQVYGCGGHSPAGLCLLNGDGVAISGDHLLGNISPNPEVNLRKERHCQGGLQDYILALKQASQWSVKLCLPGHGPIIQKLQVRLQELLQEIAARQGEILALVNGEEKNIYELAREFLINLGVQPTPSQLGLALNEVKAHLDLLEGQRRVEMLDLAGVNHYQVV